MNLNVFTYAYSQPAEYHFSLDSIETPRHVVQHLKENSISWKGPILDLCAGCGVMGLEFYFHTHTTGPLHFLEVQEAYLPYWQHNLELTGLHLPAKNQQTHFHLQNYDILQSPTWSNHFEIIICNPPYFLKDQGRHSPSEFKNRCRFYLDSSHENLIHSILNCLRPGGLAYILCRPLHEHGHNLLQEIERICLRKAKVSCLTQVRGTDLVLIQKNIST